MRKPVAILPGLALITLAAGCNTAQVPQGPPANSTEVTHPHQTNSTQGNKTSVSPGSTTTPTAHPAVSSANPGGPMIPATLPLSKQNAGPLTSVSFATDKIGFAGSQSGIIYKTTDGGNTWTEVYTAYEPIVGMQAVGTSGSQYFVVAWTRNDMVTDMAAANFSKVLFNGTQSAGFAPTPIEDVSLVPSDYEGNHFLVFVSDGVVWSSNGGGSSWLKRTPPALVASVAALDPATWYASTDGGVIYKTTDGGAHWTKVFTAPIKEGLGWNAQIQARGNHVAVLYTSPDVATGHQPYVLYESANGGQTWNKLFDEQYLKQDYGTTPPRYSNTASPQAGPFALLPHGLVALVGAYPVETSITTLSVFLPDGKRMMYTPVGPSANTPNVFGAGELPAAISAPDTTHFFVAGGNGSKAVMEVTTDGGETWHAK